MKTYADYGYYADVYGGTMDERAFTKWSIRASAYIDRITYGRMTDPAPEGVQYACCAMCEMLQAREAAKVDGKNVQSVSNAGYSVTFSQGERADTSEAAALHEIAQLYVPPDLLSMWAYGEACNE